MQIPSKYVNADQWWIHNGELKQTTLRNFHPKTVFFKFPENSHWILPPDKKFTGISEAADAAACWT